ncbi:hypothetical protein CROQUDRAFT_347662 [Cronartium quercuum f. sp. fusiforme G11]|uniref:Uncharacterized protein n=1 Tax=Cronartium quercuum f. sp. fusiforme G11 TaxID=708437 RepID=A0A9P6N6J0_9BASI|nr:hypothetical protein CROQUDRAFT_347662 [Cronartium quercuum f. sp. fusiforme G11]
MVCQLSFNGVFPRPPWSPNIHLDSRIYPEPIAMPRFIACFIFFTLMLAALTVCIDQKATDPQSAQCLVCLYDSRAYQAHNPASQADTFCKSAMDQLGLTAHVAYNTHYRDPKGIAPNTQVTMCRAYLRPGEPAPSCARFMTSRDRAGRQLPRSEPMLMGYRTGTCTEWPQMKDILDV